MGIVKNQIVDLAKSGERQEGKIDHMSQKLDRLSVIDRSEFEKYKQHVEATYLKLESIKGLKTIGYSIATALAIAIAMGLLRLLGANL